MQDQTATQPTDTSPSPAAALARKERNRWPRRILVANLVVQIGIIVTGGLVRLTGSGLGCPTWPQCVEGSYVPTREMALGIHPYVEFGNRLLTFVLAVVALAVLWAVHRPLATRRGLRWPAWLVLGGILLQAVVGGISVRMDLSPLVVSLHFVVSAALVAVSMYLVHRFGEGDGPPRPLVAPVVRAIAYVTAAVGAVLVLLGTLVTGAGPHSGDAAEPDRNGFDPRVLSWVHADVALLFVGLAVAVWLACRLTQTVQTAPTSGIPARAWAVVLVVCLCQGAVGYTQYFTGLPVGLVLVHMLLAALFVAAVTRGVLVLRAR